MMVFLLHLGWRERKVVLRMFGVYILVLTLTLCIERVIGGVVKNHSCHFL